jgi:hypothetical protein
MDADDFFAEVALLIREEWRRDANCKDVWPQVFFRAEYEDYAKRFCAGCAVKLECLNSSMNRKDKFVRGGFTEAERVPITNHQKRNHQYFDYDVFEYGLDGEAAV